MALAKEEIDRLKASLKEVKSKKAGFFFYCVAGANGDPVLLISKKKIVKSEITVLRKTARKKKFVGGQVSFQTAEDGKPPTFVFQTAAKSKVFEKHVKTFFGRSVARLKKAEFSLLSLQEDSEEPLPVADDEEEVAVADANESGVKRSSLDQDLSALSSLSGPGLVDALSALKLNEINFEGITPEGSPEAVAQAYEAQANDIVNKIAQLEALLRHVQAQREASAQEAAELNLSYNGLVRDGADKKKQLAAKARLGDAQDQTQALLAQENEIRALLGVGHAQLQNRYVEASAARDDGVEQSALARLTPEQVEEIQSARKAQAARIQEQKATVDEMVAQLARLDKERQAELARMSNKEAVALQKLNNPRYEERARERLRQIDERRDALANDLSAYRLELDKMRADYLLDQAKSDLVTDLWTEETEAHWQERQNVEDDAFYNEQLRDLTEAETAYDDAHDHHEEIEQQVRKTRDTLSSLDEKIGALTAERDGLKERYQALKDRLARVDQKIKTASVISNKKALKEKRAALLAEMDVLKNARGDELKEQIQELGDRRDEETARLETLEEEERRSWEKMHDAHKARNRTLLSEEERELADALELRKRALDEEVRDRADTVAEARKAEAAARERIDGFVQAEQAFNAARAALLAIEEKHRQIKKEATKHRGLRFRKAARDKIDAARAELPDVEIELEQARRAFEAAQADFASRRAEFGDDQQKADLLAEAERLAKARLETERDLASAETQRASLERQVTDQEVRICNLSEDIYRQRRDRHQEMLLASLDEDREDPHPIRVAIEDAEARLRVEDAALERQTHRLIEWEGELQTLKEKLAGDLPLEEMDGLLDRQKTLQAELTAHRAVVLAQEARYTAANDARLAARGELLAYARELSTDAPEAVDSAVIDIAGDLVRSSEALSGAKERKAELTHENETAIQEDEAQARSRADLDRRARLLDVQTRMTALVTSDKTRATIEKFHTLAGPITEKSESFDLLSDVDQKKIQKRIQDNQIKPEDFHALMQLHAELEAQAIEMIARGATGEELEAAFVGIPNGLRPPSYRAEIAKFYEIQSMLVDQELEDRVNEAADKAKAQQLTTPEGAKKLREKLGGLLKAGDEKVAGPINDMLTEFDNYVQQGFFQEGGFKLGGFTSADVQGIQGASGQEAGTNPERLGDSHTQIGRATSVYSGVKAVQAIVEHARIDATKMDPVERQMHEDAFFDNLSNALSASFQVLTNNADILQLADKSPIFGLLGMVDKGKQLVESIVKTGARRANKAYDQFLQSAARVAGSALAGAFEESKKQEAFLFKKYGVKSLSSAAGITSDILSAFPGTAAVGAVIGLVGFVGDKLANAMLNRMERKQILKAKALLDRANSGDDIAKVELFKNHALYAKGLIAHMAEQKDGFAMAFVRSRGLTDAAVAGSSQQIVMRYLLKKSEQSAEQYDDDALVPSWRKLLSKAKQALNRVGALFKQSWWELERSGLVDTLSAFEGEVAQLAPTRKKAEQMVSSLDEKIGEAARGEGREQLEERRGSVRLVVDTFDETVTESLDQLQTHLKAVIDHEAGETALTESAVALTVPLMKRSLRNSIKALNDV